MMTRFAEYDRAGPAATSARHATFFLLFWLVLFRATVSDAAETARSEQQSATPESIKSTIAELEKLSQQTLDKTGVPGLAVAVVYDDKVVELKGFGVRQIGRPESIDADTVFQIASVSKAVTSTVLARLVSEGTIQWDDRVIDHDPEFQMSDPWVTRQLTLRDLLCHRSGLPDHAGDLLEDLGYDRAEVLYRLRYLDCGNNFRSHYAYTNFGYSEAALAAAHAVGKPWEELAAEKLYRPLGMMATSSRYQDYAAAKNHAALHARINGKWQAKYVRQPDAQSPAGGVSSTVRDLAQWMRLQLADGKFDGKQLISAEALGETHRPQIINRRPDNPDIDRAGMYGFGWNISYDDHGRIHLIHSGGFELGAATVVHLVPSEKLGIVALTNASPIGVPEAIASTFCDLAIDGKVQRDWFELYRKGFEALSKANDGTGVDDHRPPAKALPAAPNAAYVGKYSNRYFGEIEVVEKDGKLQLRMGPKKVLYPMEHWDRDVFIYQPTGEMAAGLSGVTFTIGPSQTATLVLIENLNVYGQGTFISAATDKQK